MAQATTLTSKEIKRVIQAIKLRKYAVRDLTIFYFGLYSGLRAKELASLRISNVYDENWNVRDSFVLQKEQTKGSKTRIVYISTALKKTLISYKQRLSNLTYDSYLFSTRKSKCFSANTMSQLFLNIFKEAQLDDASCHSLRRTFITELAHKGVNVRVLQQLSGHSHLNTTMRYIDYNPKQLSNAVELMTI